MYNDNLDNEVLSILNDNQNIIVLHTVRGSSNNKDGKNVLQIHIAFRDEFTDIDESNILFNKLLGEFSEQTISHKRNFQISNKKNFPNTEEGYFLLGFIAFGKRYEYGGFIDSMFIFKYQVEVIVSPDCNIGTFLFRRWGSEEIIKVSHVNKWSVRAYKLKFYRLFKKTADLFLK